MKRLLLILAILLAMCGQGWGAIVDQYLTINGLWSLSVGRTNGRIMAGQSFPGLGYTLTDVQFKVGVSGSPTGSVVAKLYTHSGTYGTSSVPTTPALATSDAVAVGSLSQGGESWYTFTFTTPYVSTNGVYYVVYLDCSGVTGDDSNCVNVSRDTVTLAHAGNSCFYVSSWAAQSAADTAFIVDGTAPAATNTGKMFQLF